MGNHPSYMADARVDYGATGRDRARQPGFRGGLLTVLLADFAQGVTNRDAKPPGDRRM